METLLNNLKRRGFCAHLASGKDGVLKILTDNIPPGSTVGFGGSKTAEQLDLPRSLSSMGYICNHTGVSDCSWNELCQKNRFADYYISSTNALTEDGVLVNMDGRSNRVSAMCYGPKKVFIVAGSNKICADIPAAISRVENVAAPLNAKRLGRNTPCAITGKCSHCNSPETICKTLVLHYHPTTTIEMHIILLNKELGY